MNADETAKALAELLKKDTGNLGYRLNHRDVSLEAWCHKCKKVVGRCKTEISDEGDARLYAFMMQMADEHKHEKT